MNPPILIEWLNPWDRIVAGQMHLVHVRVTRPSECTDVVRIPSVTVAVPNAVVNTDLFPTDIVLFPGDSQSITFGVTFPEQGMFNAKMMLIQVNPYLPDQSKNEIVSFPDREFRVIAPLEQWLEWDFKRICAYDQAVKCELTFIHRSPEAIESLELNFSPSEHIRSGPLKRHFKQWKPDTPESLEMVLVGDQLRVHARTVIHGVDYEVNRSFPVPAATAEELAQQNSRLFRFLEPRRLTRDPVQLLDKEQQKPIALLNGEFHVHGKQHQYLLRISNSDQHRKDLRFYDVPGLIETSPTIYENGIWQTQITILTDPLLSQRVRLDYDVTVGDSVQRGEVYFLMLPRSGKQLQVSLTAGAALTVKGFVGLVGVITRGEIDPDSIADGVTDLASASGWNLFYFLCMVPIYMVLGVIDYIWRKYQDW
ncbi:hypothetical protein [Tuwongella immobilis]|uniref:Uncharacterized protein n=1 Tax=Tuwongella immobilis TaxID=692036 RepID=A0A6C2YJS1_9BACT|nr:hypothetical protein [Tuwongella immobilis]VIP01202.1 unnamed protein product [Tuwongella immobilis]VTR97830.1 unnamed protein product [Tuwongella immobilis]